VCPKDFLAEEQAMTDLDNLPTLEQIRSQRLLTPLQLVEMEGWFRRSCLLGKPQEMSQGLVRALHGLGVLASLGPGATMH
jgi:hypothetical protein